MNSWKKAVFNPTAIPGRGARASTRQYTANRAPRRVLKGENHGGIWQGRRRISTETGEDKSGHIAAGSNEGILFFDSES